MLFRSLIGFLFCVLLVGLKVRVLILIFIYVALRFDFLVFLHELVNELAHTLKSMINNVFSFLFSILLLISAASKLLWCLLGDGLTKSKSLLP